MFRFMTCGLLALSALFFTACSSRSRVDGFSSGYDKITVARAETIKGAESDSIAPEFITEIRRRADVVTAVYLYQSMPGRQQALTTSLSQHLRTSAGQIPGLVSFNVHQGENGRRVFNYMQFENRKFFDAFRASQVHRQMVDKLRGFVESSDLEVYQLVLVQH